MMSGPEGIRNRVRRRLGEQRTLVRSLLALREQLQGSLFVRYGECGKANCVCRQGLRHGPYYVLSQRTRGRGGFAYLEGRRAETAREMVGRYRTFRRGLRRLRAINLDLVALLRTYQRSMTRLGKRRLGLTAPSSS